MDYLVYMFQFLPGSEFKYYIPVLIFTGILVLTGLYIRNRIKKEKAFRKIFKNSSGNYFTVAVITLFLLWARYEEIAFISMRFILLLSILSGLFLLYRSISKYRKDYPEMKEKLNRREQTTSKKKVYSHSKKK